MTHTQPRMPRPSPAGDDGSTLVLTIFYGFLSLVLILMVVAATSLYIERKRLFTLADGAALAGAEAFALGSVENGANGMRPGLGSPDVATAARAYLADAPHSGLEGVRVTRAASVDGQSATVSLAAWWRPPVLTLLIPEGLPIEVTAVARSVFW